MSSCTGLVYQQTYQQLGTYGIEINIETPEVYDCTNLQLRLRSETGIYKNWYDYTVINTTGTTINFAISPEVCYIDTRLSKCCAPDPDSPAGGGGTLSPDEPPCTIIAATDSECFNNNGSLVPITNPYRRPSDSGVSTPYNYIEIPKKVYLTISQTGCSNVEAKICTVRCAPIPIGACSCAFLPSIDIDTLNQIPISGYGNKGVPIDIDRLCNSTSNHDRPTFTSPPYIKIEAYCSAAFGALATPTISGIARNTRTLNRNTWIKVHTAENSKEMREWLIDNFRFFSLNNENKVVGIWPYNDLYWTPHNLCISQEGFVPESGTVYVEIVPC